MDKVISPFEDIEMVALPDKEQARFGSDIFRTVKEFQSGYAGNEQNPKVFRTSQSGIWLGQPRFIDPPVNPNDPLKFQVDMLGNVLGVSFATNFRGQRVQLTKSDLIFWDRNNIFQGDIFGSSTLNALIVLARERLVLAAGTGGNTVHAILNSILDQFIFFKVAVLAYFNADPPVVNGGMYYNTNTNKARVCENGAWQDIV